VQLATEPLDVTKNTHCTFKNKTVWAQVAYVLCIAIFDSVAISCLNCG